MTDDDNGGSDELIDVFAIDITPDFLRAGMNFTTVDLYDSVFGFARLELSFELECQSGFVGQFCIPNDIICNVANCNNNGTCQPNEDNINGYTCSCSGGFTGENCESRIGFCEGITCGNGVCLSRFDTFTCLCDAGYTGDFCEVKLDPVVDESSRGIVEAEEESSVSSSGVEETGSNTIAIIIGAVVGAVMFTLISIVGVMIIVRLLLRRRSKAIKGKAVKLVERQTALTTNPPLYNYVVEQTQEAEANQDLDNPVYGMFDTPYRQNTDNTREKDLKNPIYGLPDTVFDRSLSTVS